MFDDISRKCKIEAYKMFERTAKIYQPNEIKVIKNKMSDGIVLDFGKNRLISTRQQQQQQHLQQKFEK